MTLIVVNSNGDGIPNISVRPTDRPSDENVRGMAFGKGEGLRSVRLHLPHFLPSSIDSREAEGDSLAREMHRMIEAVRYFGDKCRDKWIERKINAKGGGKAKT